MNYGESGDMLSPSTFAHDVVEDDMTLGVRCDDLTVNFRGDDILTLERVVGFCEYCIVNKIIDTYET